MCSSDLVTAVSDAERLARYRAAREREDGITLRVQREKIATALTIADTRRRDRELHKIAHAIRGYAWCLSMSDAAILRAQIPTSTDPERLEREAVERGDILPV